MANSVLVVAGTRPEAIKLSPVFKWLQKLKVNTIFVWSGQHYDYELSKIFFEELRLPDPDLNLDVKSGSHSVQTAKVMVGLEEAIRRYEPTLIMAEGDTNSVAATALAAIKSHVPFAHVEAGLRSYDRTMPEEVNRTIADSCSELLFAPTELAVANLTHEGTPLRKIHLTGNTIIDVVNEHREMAIRRGKKLLEELNVKPYEYLLVTVHRQENTEILANLSNIIQALSMLSEKYRIVFPIHPRTMSKLLETRILENLKRQRNLTLIPPLGYFEFLGVLFHSLIVLTDSGGVQEEAFTLRVPTVTLRYNTERPETVLYGTNVLAGTEPDSIIRLTKIQLQKCCGMRKRPQTTANPLGRGDAGKSIATTVKTAIENGIKVETNDSRKDPYIVYMLMDLKQLKKTFKLSGVGFEIMAAYDLNGSPILIKNPLKYDKMPCKLLVRASLSTIKKLRKH